uniref:mitogen-activated protein kinase kinase n=1 Tax=Dicentrarchus labrax TaxID=13489 RepID=A0A8C4F2X7_DICLA
MLLFMLCFVKKLYSLNFKTLLCFLDEDEVGDRITVRSDEELNAMLSYYCNTMNEQRMNGLLPDPLQIFPRGTECYNIHYQEQLGHGNGGTVYKAYHLLGKRVLAVKVIPLDITVELQKQIMSELEILYKCDSPYIITFFSAFFVENRISICTEFMDGGSLDVYKRIPEHVLGRIAVAVVKGLTYLWSLKILHRDVKPSNMLVNTRGQVKLCDFGVSTQLVNSIAKTYVGTNAYMAPERISGEQYGIHADVWSVGISFMEVQQCLNVLPVSQFTEKFDHSFIIQYNDGNAEVVSMWVCRCLEERRAQQAQGHV